ncbi:hypothetical protein [uncultured Psychroserpens sp.]|uniref:hypothetical protein n=1 Tax=uncultured Psychroserpens sp. TaxID=255436 RepID=UPI002624EB98|nr:hypothetical protein [uncultured Psychroserpens sp.]
MKTVIKYAVGAETLQKVLMASLKAESTYEFLISKTNSEHIVNWLHYRKENTTDFILKVLIQLEQMEVKPKSISNIQSKVHAFFSNFKSLIAPMSDEAVIKAALKADSFYLNRLKEIRKSVVVTNELYQFYTNQINMIASPSKQLDSHNTLIS